MQTSRKLALAMLLPVIIGCTSTPSSVKKEGSPSQAKTIVSWCAGYAKRAAELGHGDFAEVFTKCTDDAIHIIDKKSKVVSPKNTNV